MDHVNNRMESRNPGYSWVLAALSIVFLVGAVFLFYDPTLPGPFIFDDGANLQRLEAYADLGLWERMRYFVTNDGQSLIERPLSYLSFFINDHAWPSNPEGFRHTNIAIHAINTLLVLWLALRLLELTSFATNGRQRLFLATGVALLWGLHPIQVNAVAYIIQRMTLLAGTFTFAGLLCYLGGRQLLAQGKIRLGLGWMSAAILVCMPLAFLSKQTGVLLPLYLFTIEAALLREVPGHRLARRWGYAFLGLPVAAVVTALTLKAHDKIFQWYDALPFSPAERLLTESRVLWDYLFALLLPRAHLSSLYHDNYPISHTLLDPPSTLVATASLVLIVVAALVLRKRVPLLFFAVFWFLLGHLLESSLIGLELYYEHRNYLPSFGILFALLVGGYRLLANRKAVFVTLAAVYIGLTIFVGYLNASKWHSEAELITAWYEDNPESIRTMKTMTGLLHAAGRGDMVRKILVQQQQRWPQSAELPLMLLLIDCLDQKTTSSSTDATLASIPKDYWHSNTLSEIVSLLHKPIVAEQCAPLALDDLEKIVVHLLENPRAQASDKSPKWGALTRNLYYNLAEIGRDQRNLNKAIRALEQGNAAWPTPQLLITKMHWLMSAGLYQDALAAARDALALSRKRTLNAYLNPHERMLTGYIAELEKITRAGPQAPETN